MQFGSSSAPVQFRGAESVLKIIGRFGNLGGTYTLAATSGTLTATSSQFLISIAEAEPNDTYTTAQNLGTILGPTLVKAILALFGIVIP